MSGKAHRCASHTTVRTGLVYGGSLHLRLRFTVIGKHRFVYFSIRLSPPDIKIDYFSTIHSTITKPNSLSSESKTGIFER